MNLENTLRSWMIDLRSRNLSPRTSETYSLAVVQLTDFLKQQGHSLDVSEVTTTDLRDFIGHMLATRSDATAHQRYRSLSGFFSWLLTEEEITIDPMVKVTRPKVKEKPIEVVTTRQYEALLKTCDSTFLGRRDEAIIRVLWDCGMRISELTGLRVEDVSLDLDLAWVEGKTGERKAPFTIATARSLDRYIRMRAKHRNAHLSALWLSDRGKGEALTKSGVHRMLDRRSQQAHIGHVHCHMFRHSAAHRLLAAGMTEGSVMEVMGWSDRSMLDRYGRSVRNIRALDDYRRLIG